MTYSTGTMTTTTLGPVHYTNVKEAEVPPKKGIGLCLSGGGYRAMLFHLGAIWRLNEAGLLSKLSRVSSVSGGAILAARLALKWSELRFDDSGVGTRFKEEVAEPIFNLAGVTIDGKSIVSGLLKRGSISQKVEEKYKEHLLGEATLRNLPNEPRFFFNATCLKSGVLWRLSKKYAANYRIGKIDKPDFSLAFCAAASSAFPPFLSPARREIDPNSVTEFKDDNEEQEESRFPDLTTAEYRRELVLIDGGVYDNLCLETVWKRYETVLVSDGGAPLDMNEDPQGNWVSQLRRAIAIMGSQVCSLRKRHLIHSYERELRKGTYWGISTDIANYEVNTPLSLSCPHKKTMKLAQVDTRLQRMPQTLQRQLTNWGYAVCDAALVKYQNDFSDCISMPIEVPQEFPFPNEGISHR